jgi:hypothetical protein
VRHNHAVLGSWDELIGNVGLRPGMWVGRARYSLVRSFVGGAACGGPRGVQTNEHRYLLIAGKLAT